MIFVLNISNCRFAGIFLDGTGVVDAVVDDDDDADVDDEPCDDDVNDDDDGALVIGFNAGEW